MRYVAMGWRASALRRITRVLCTALAVASLAACRDGRLPSNPSTETNASVSVNLVPDVITLSPGQTSQLTATVIGTTNQATLWTSSDPAIATVSGAGLVRGVAPGSAMISAASQASPGAVGATTVTVAAQQPVVASNPTIVISSITEGATRTVVNPANVQGSISVNSSLIVPAGVSVARVEFLVDSLLVTECTRTLSAVPPDSVGCAINTAAYLPISGVRYANGTHAIVVRAVLANSAVGASARVDVAFNNPNFMVVSVSSSGAPVAAVAAPRSVAPADSMWRSGAITVTVLPVLFQRAPSDSLREVTVAVTTSGAGVSGVVGCAPTGVSAPNMFAAVQDPTIALADGGGGSIGTNAGATPNCPGVSATLTDNDGANGYSVVFPDTLRLSEGGVNGIEERLSFAVQSVTRGGQPGPACINPGTGNPLVQGPGGANCGTGLGTASPANRVPMSSPWLHDNLAPRFTSLNILRMGTDAFFNSQTFSSGAGAAASDTTIGARTVDYGVGGQTAAGHTTFLAGLSLSAMVELANTNSLAESAAAYLFQSKVKDALNNQRTGTATTNRFVIASSTTALPAGSGAHVQLFGVDFTAPVITIGSGTPANNTSSANSAVPGAYALVPADPGTIASGFAVKPFKVKTELINSAGTACYDLEAGSTVDCTAAAATFASDGQFDLAGAVNGYWRVTWSLVDRAGNASASATRLHLVDATFPSVTITSPTSIIGGQSVSFTAAAADNVELKDGAGFVGYVENGLSYEIEEPAAMLGSYGAESLASHSTVTTTIPGFIRSIESTAGALPSGTVARATSFNYLVRDLVDNTTRQAVTILTTVASGIGGTGAETSWRGAGRSFSAAVNGVPSYLLTTNASTICADTDGDGCSTAATRLLTVTATGPALTFANPFARVSFYVRHAGTNRLVLIGTGTPSSSDHPATNVRTWSYAVNFTAPAGFAAGTVHNVIAIGVDASGRGLASAFVGLTQVPD